MKNILNGDSFVAVDVGAANGLLAHWVPLEGVVKIYQIEAREDTSLKHHVIKSVVAEKNEDRTLWVSNVPTWTSLYEPKPNPDWDDYVDLSCRYPAVQEQIKTERIGDLIPELIDLIKLDIQGGELSAIKGMRQSQLENVLGIELEVGMHGYYPQTFGEIEKFMTSIGMELFDIRGISKVGLHNRHFPQNAERIWEVDAIYFRKKSLINPSDYRRMMIVYMIYDYYAEAFKLAEILNIEKSIVDAYIDRKSVLGKIKRYARKLACLK